MPGLMICEGRIAGSNEPFCSSPGCNLDSITFSSLCLSSRRDPGCKDPILPRASSRGQIVLHSSGRTTTFSSGAGWKEVMPRKAALPAPSAATAGSAMLFLRNRIPTLCFPSTFSSRDIICPSWGRTPLCAARGLALHDVGHPLGQPRCDDRGRRQLVHHVGKGYAAIHVDNHRRAAHAAPGTHPAFRDQAITDAELERYAYHEVDPVALHFEDPVDRLRREEPDAIDLAAAGHRRLEAR